MALRSELDIFDMNKISVLEVVTRGCVEMVEVARAGEPRREAAFHTHPRSAYLIVRLKLPALPGAS